MGKRSKEDEARFEQAVKEVFRIYMESIVEGNIDKWITVWDEDGVQLPPGSPMRVGRTAIKKAVGADLTAFVYYDPQWGSVHTFVDDEYGFAYGTASFKRRTKATGEVLTIDLKFETIFRRQADGSWKIYRDCFNSNVPR